MIGCGPGKLTHQRVEPVPAGDPLELERQLLGHDGRESGRRRHRVAAGERLIEKPEVKLSRFGRLPQVGAVSIHERVGVFDAGEFVDQQGIEPGRGPRARFVGRGGGEVELVPRAGRLEVSGAGGILRGRQHGGRRRARRAGEPGLDCDVGGVGAAEFAGQGHELHDLLLAGGGGVLRDGLRERLELRRLRIGLRVGRERRGSDAGTPPTEHHHRQEAPGGSPGTPAMHTSPRSPTRFLRGIVFNRLDHEPCLLSDVSCSSLSPRLSRRRVLPFVRSWAGSRGPALHTGSRDTRRAAECTCRRPSESRPSGTTPSPT